jgi:diaminohydroxyphosphoribosylaminopyrimidine deaminase/5-amino-6-(5-phosphoribosylamino)uracil reductase
VRDDDAMGRALTLAAGARRRTAPNPWVGCVLVRDGEVVGAGATQPPGHAHAEAEALAEAGPRARGATAYVTLEPCSHDGRTPPCADALVEAGVARVVVALRDPDPRVSGRGLARLRRAGVDVVEGAGRAEAERQLAPYLHQRRTGTPYVVCKTATSLDARTAAADGTSRWITGPDARADAHGLRADSQAIVVGSGTALADRPALTVRDASPLPVRPPLRVLLDGRGRVPADGPLFDRMLAPTLVITTEATPPERVDAWSAAGARVATVPGARGGGVDLGAALALLAGAGVLQVLVEGGATVHASFMGECRAHRLVAYVAPVILGTEGRAGYGLAGAPTIAAAPRYRLAGVTRVGDDVRLDLDLHPEGTREPAGTPGSR